MQQWWLGGVIATKKKMQLLLTKETAKKKLEAYRSSDDNGFHWAEHLPLSGAPFTVANGAPMIELRQTLKGQRRRRKHDASTSTAWERRIVAWTAELQCGKNDGGRCAASTVVRGGGGEGGRRKSGFPWRWTAGSEEPSVVLNIAWTAVVRRCENGAMVVSRAQRRGGGLQGSRRERRWFETVRREKKEERKGFCAFQKPTY